ncbi:MAG: hypothetical protein LBS10_06035, partial [Gracilibacteraceae bacterium]|nr:hypothetical protein [Gracilibacteraceae bacterium]
MAYIPAAHEKYDLLPRCRKRGGEVFSYSSTKDIDALLPVRTHITPYGYKSYDEYYAQLNEYIELYGTDGG